ncbi:dimethylargininase [Ornithinimicrobium cavernae]|uniref:dimethylargininase n=1 Tax=Ornithinimicrobium cavernae TaxID=2666047 RepID=UPI000D699FA6|nr:dimethylargininase [Ornithinimicrobium cavernae]
MAPRALVREPSPRLAEGLVTHVERSDTVDPVRAVRQWEAYRAALAEAGFAVTEVSPAPEHPDSVFVEDALLVVQDLAVVTAPGARERRDEVNGTRVAARMLGLETVELVHGHRGEHDEPVRLDGGDVLKIGTTCYVGVGGRTTRAGADALGRLLADLGWVVVPVPVRQTLHLKSQVTALPDGTVVGYPPRVDEVARWSPFLPVPEPEGAHVVVLDEQTVLMSDAAPRSAELFAERGLSVVALDVSEFVKLEGCVTCLSVRLHPYD